MKMGNRYGGDRFNIINLNNSRKRNISYNELKREKEILVNEFIRNYTHLFGLKISKILIIRFGGR